MHRGNLQRIDRCGMRWGLEVREPFLDPSIVVYSRNLSREALIKTVNGLPQGKQPLREIYDLHPEYLPALIRNRHKLVFSEGAGIGSERDAWRQLFEESVSDQEFEEAKREFAEFEVSSKEEYFYLRALSRKLDIDRVPHLKARLRLYVPHDLAPMPTEMARLHRDAA
jgi:asparagine synthase (glutamine-hydrolysing)